MHIKLDKICVATDFSDAAAHSLTYGVALAKEFKAQLHLLHVVPDVDPHIGYLAELGVAPSDHLLRFQRTVTDQLDRIPLPKESEGVRVVRQVRIGVPFHEICEYAKQERIDLLILGTHGRTGIRHLLIGSVAERVVRSAPCPVLTVRHPEHEFVVPG